MKELLYAAAILGFVGTLIEGHGYLLDPPARGSAWRKGFGTPADTNDMANYCGGRGTQHDQKNKGRCGVCGEEYSNPQKRLEPGPANKFATGTIVGSYRQGNTIDVTVVATAFHKGYYEFRLCENNVPQKGQDSSIAVTLECLNKNLLVNAKSGETRFTATPGTSTHSVILPSEITCSACVLQWRYRTGNNWGCEKDVCGSGLGAQEEFVGCADIAIKAVVGETTEKSATEIKTTEEATTKQPTTEKHTTEKPTTEKPTTSIPTTEIPTTEKVTTEKATEKATTEKPTTEKPTTEKTTTKKATTEKTTTEKATTEKTTTEKPTTEKPTTVEPTTKRPTTQKATPMKVTTARRTPAPPTVPVKPVEPAKGGRKVCRGINNMFHSYCRSNCFHNPPYCPPSHCKCKMI